jgi:hypothetical protein
MTKGRTKKVQTDADVKRKAVKLVISHLKRKIPEGYNTSEQLKNWLADMDNIMSKPEFDFIEYIEMRKQLNDIIERTMDEELRFKLRDSWYSMGRALDKKVKHR